jgi:GNAT superfamily N-acetyltransferase
VFDQRLPRPGYRPSATFESVELLVLDTLDARRRQQLVELLDLTWWASGRSPDEVQRMLEHSDAVIALVDPAGDRLVGFARAISDRTFRALVLDVVVSPEQRGRGLGDRVMEELLAHPALAGVESIELACQPELHGFYRRFGFTERIGRSTRMKRATREYAQPAPPAGT